MVEGDCALRAAGGCEHARDWLRGIQQFVPVHAGERELTASGLQACYRSVAWRSLYVCSCGSWGLVIWIRRLQLIRLFLCQLSLHRLIRY